MREKRDTPLILFESLHVHPRPRPRSARTLTGAAVFSCPCGPMRGDRVLRGAVDRTHSGLRL